MEVVLSILFVYTIIVAILLLCVLFIFYNTSEGYYSDILARKEFQKKCPKCRDIWYDRIYRKYWMRLIPGTKYYYCSRCRSKFMIIFGRSALKMAYKRLQPLSLQQGFSIPKTILKTRPYRSVLIFLDFLFRRTCLVRGVSIIKYFP